MNVIRLYYAWWHKALLNFCSLRFSHKMKLGVTLLLHVLSSLALSLNLYKYLAPLLCCDLLAFSLFTTFIQNKYLPEHLYKQLKVMWFFSLSNWATFPWLLPLKIANENDDSHYLCGIVFTLNMLSDTTLPIYPGCGKALRWIIFAMCLFTPIQENKMSRINLEPRCFSLNAGLRSKKNINININK